MRSLMSNDRYIAKRIADVSISVSGDIRYVFI